ncbi:gamma-tubulin complex component protein [Schizophyllum amplum]|uniref:Spindle pole body component n=1 Tax=Schizophyllum amplum TaxID=97359 RepID=A0A550CX55_9AGAR|nr:gamma-tubulin complex component protein [Auriculariopsis ampla]
MIDGKDNVVSESLIQRFVNIGTMMRRLEQFVNHLKARHEGPTGHALRYAMLTILAYLRDVSVDASIPLGDATFHATWLRYSDLEDMLNALTALLGRTPDKEPKDFDLLDFKPVPLLSRLYEHLNLHVERQSPRTTRAILAFLLTHASVQYFDHLSASVGLGLSSAESTEHALTVAKEVDDAEEDVMVEEHADTEQHTYPSFMPNYLSELLPRAHRSLVLLRAAVPDHTLLKDASDVSLTWFWSIHDIEASQGGTDNKIYSRAPSSMSSDSTDYLKEPSKSYKPDLSQFRLFDLHPGAHLSSATLVTTSTSPLHAFISSFPDALPPLTPTVAHLTDLVLQPLAFRAETLSRALLAVFFTSSMDLNFRAHLEVLRSYLLCTSPAFTARLTAALFDNGADRRGTQTSMMVPGVSSRARQRTVDEKARVDAEPWAMGLSPALLERGSWPPVGADLSFLLRTVILDSFEATCAMAITLPSTSNDDEDDRHWRDRAVLKYDVDNRLGFAIRDLPEDTGKEGWLNPLCTALDFLYMEYRPPHPLDVLIGQDTLTKYQRLFSFILRLLRVQHALSSLYRISADTVAPVFDTLVPSRKKFLHLRFTAHSFVSAFSGYVFDTAIRGNFDAFLDRVSASASQLSSPVPDVEEAFSDVFALADAHSGMMNDILSACLLRSGQRAVGKLLQQSLETILQLCIMIGELKEERIEEYRAATALDEIYETFATKMSTLYKVLQGMCDKGPGVTLPRDTAQTGNEKQPMRPVGGQEALGQLLLRLDMGLWWTKCR